jgi:hypothetical protein
MSQTYKTICDFFKMFVKTSDVKRYFINMVFEKRYLIKTNFASICGSDLNLVY